MLSACQALLAASGGRQRALQPRAAGGSPPGHAPAPGRRRPSRLRVDAFAQGCAPAGRAPRQNPDGTYERVLRYPNGQERRIRYPLPPPDDLRREDLTDGCWGDSCWEPRAAWLGLAAGGGEAGAARGTAAPAEAPADFVSPQNPPAEPEGGASAVPASPMELLRYLTSPEYKRSQEEQWARVRGSYEVLDAVPWVAPRPLYLLATEQRAQPSAAAAAAAAARFGGDAAPGLTYSLRTRVARAAAADELSLVLKKRAPDGSPLLQVSEMKDGVVAFEDAADAERYGQMLEAEGSAEVSIARCDSHELFRTVQDVKAVVVLLRAGHDFLPQPHQLATSLRSEKSAPGDGGAAWEPLLD